MGNRKSYSTNNTWLVNEKGITYISLLLKYLLPLFLFSLIIHTLFRVHLLQIIHHDLTVLFPDSERLKDIIIKSFAKGIRYDLVITSYIFLIPLLGLIIAYFTNLKPRIYSIISKIYFAIAFAIVLLIAYIDFPYFKYFWTHPTVTIFNWAGYSSTYGMLLEETSYYIYYFFYFLSLSAIILSCKYLSRWALNSKSIILSNRPIQIIILALSSLMLFFGTNGQLSTRPIDLQPGYFTESFLVSDLCFSPAYYFAVTRNHSHEINISEMMEVDKALERVKEELGVKTNETFKNPLSRVIEADTTKLSKDLNIVLVFMESLSADLMHQTIDRKQLTPYLDSLASQSYFFENFYSSGVHTNVGVGTTLSSYPSRFATKVMYRNPVKYKGFATTLRDYGYSTSFFIPNEFEYDHMGFFLEENGFDNIFVDRHYPKEAVVNMYGVPDDFLLNFALEDMNKQGKTGKPFMSCVLTVSNHPPYVVPKEFSDIWSDDGLGIVAYADNAIKNFMQKAALQDWYENTIFIFQGDHGKIFGTQKYSMPLSYNHIPLIVYSPAFEDMPQKFTQLSGQIDIFPTIMGLLNKGFTNNTLGVDLLTVERPYMFFSNDTHLGCIDNEFLYVYHPMDKSEYLYDYRNGKSTNILNENKDKALAMREYALSMMVTTDFIETNRLSEVY